MEQNVHLIFKYASETAIMRLHCFKSHDAIVEYVLSKWRNLCSHDVSLSYSISDFSNCILSNEDEFQSMCFVASHSRMNFVEIVVKDSNSMVSANSESDGSRGNVINPDTVSHKSSYPISDQMSTNYLKPPKQLLSAHWSNLIKGACQFFKGGMREFRVDFLKYCIVNGFRFFYAKNSPTVLRAYCCYRSAYNCQWRISVLLDKHNGGVYIKKYIRKHTCGHVDINLSDPRLSSDIVSTLIEDMIKENPLVGPTEVVKHIKSIYGLVASYHKARDAVFKAHSKVFGDTALSYDVLRRYCERITFIDPKATVRLEYNNESRQFDRCFVSFGAAHEGFKHCRPMIFLDGTFLTGKYKGVLLAATAKDGNNGLFNIAYAVVGSEDIENWTWFFKILKPIVHDRQITFISDRSKGIINAVDTKFPNSSHSYCLIHIMKNLKDKFRGSKGPRERMVYLLGRMAHATTKEDFDHHMNIALEEGGQRMVEFMTTLPPEHFAIIHFHGARYGEMTSNAAESFNAQIKRYKHLSITELFDQIRRHMMQQMNNRRVELDNWAAPLCPRFMNLYNISLEQCRSWNVVASSSSLFEVMSEPSFTVDVARRNCSCGYWQHKGFPCPHAVAVLQRREFFPFHQHIDTHFHSQTYRNCYAFNIPPIDGVVRTLIPGEAPSIIPPQVTRPPGRPKKNRIKGRFEGGSGVKCSRCHKYGHNKRTCKAPI